MTNELAIKVLRELRGYGDKFANIGYDRKEALDMAIKTLEQEPCEDCISRETVLDIINNPLNIRIDEIIEKLPSVTPKAETEAYNKGYTDAMRDIGDTQ